MDTQNNVKKKDEKKDEVKQTEQVDEHKKDHKCKEDRELLQKQVEEYKSKYLRALADYQNYEKRMIDERQRIMRMAHMEVLIQLLPVFDNIDKAGIFYTDEGLKMVITQLKQILHNMGLKEIDIVGKEFDPYNAEAVELVPSDKENIVLEVLTKGYQYDGEMVRPAKVKVGKKQEEKQ